MDGQLNSEQSAAAECLDRPVLVTAAAGTGKTRMLAQRFLNAVVPGAVPGWVPARVGDVLAVTFTEKAAGEITERVRLALRARGCVDEARVLGNCWISTIHALSSRLLRRHAFEAGTDPLFEVGDTVTVGRLQEEAFEKAVRAALAEAQDSVELFEVFDYSAVFSATVGVCRELVVAGCGPEELELEAAESIETLVEDARALFRRGMTTCDLGYAGSSSAPFDHARRCEELLGSCPELMSDDLTDDGRMSGLLDVLDSYKPLRQLKGMEEVVSDLRELKVSLTGRVAAALVAPHATMFKRLVSGYFKEYEAGKRLAGVLDFDDLQARAARLLEECPEVANLYRSVFRVVMVDEFQDTDALQLRLIEQLSSHNLCSVGDEHQSIYRFRGADVDVYRDHRERMRRADALVTTLAVNYRSHSDVLKFVNAVFASEEYFGGEFVRLEGPSQGREGNADLDLAGAPRVEALLVDSTDVGGEAGRLAEAASIAARLAELRHAGVQPRDMAVLLRTYSHAHIHAKALSDQGLPAIVVGGNRFFGLSEIAVMRALNRAIANPEDGAALGTLLASDFVPVSSDALVILRLGAGERDTSTLWALLCERAVALRGIDREAVDRLVAVMRRAHDRVGRVPLHEVLLRAVEEAGWDLRLLAGGNLGRDAFANVLKFARQARSFEESGTAGPAAFAEYLDAKERLGQVEAPASLADDRSDAVRIMSIHASKGLEFPVVAVPGLEASIRGGSPVARVRRSVQGLALAMKTPKREGDTARGATTWYREFAEVEESAEKDERARLFYVACTRAREILLVSGSMRLRPAQGTTSQAHLAKLTRLLGVKIPIDGPSDTVVEFGVPAARCRVRVVDAAELLGDAARGDDAVGGAEVLPPAAGAAIEEPVVTSAPDRLSYTQLSEFEQCPRRFWIRRVAGVGQPVVHDDRKANPLQFGNALHAALRLVDSRGSAPDAGRIAALARYFELGLSGAQRLETAVRRFCSSSTAKRLAEEQTVRREAPFSMSIAGRFLLTGAIDLYARTGTKALVVDYKSGQQGEPGDLTGRYSLQAECYALAALRDGCADVEVEFIRPEVHASDGDLQRVRFELSTADQPRIEADLLGRYDAIESSAFDPAPSGACWSDCTVPSGLCAHRQRRI